MSLLALPRWISFSSRLSRPHGVPGSYGSIVEHLDCPAPLVHDFFEPKMQRRLTLIAVHGVTLSGKNDA